MKMAPTPLPDLPPPLILSNLPVTPPLLTDWREAGQARQALRANLDTIKHTSAQTDGREQARALTSIIAKVQIIVGKRSNRRIEDATQTFNDGMDTFFREFHGHG